MDLDKIRNDFDTSELICEQTKLETKNYERTKLFIK